MKRIFSIILALTILCALIFCVGAAQNSLIDNADVLTDVQEKDLCKKIAKVSEKHGFDIAVLTTGSIGDYDILDYAEDFYESNGYAEDGIVFVALAAETPRYGYVVFGECDRIFDDSAMDELDEAFKSTYKSGNYNGGIRRFVDAVDQIAEADGAISTKTIIISILIGALLAFLIPMSVLKGQLKSVRLQAAASSYVRQDSMVLTNDRDLFLYRNIVRSAKPKNNSSGGTRTTSGGHRGRSG